MFDISEIDVNFNVKTNVDKDKIAFYDIENPPFVINGVFRENGKYRRMPEEVARGVSPGVYSLHLHNSGGRVRFRTNSAFVAISARMSKIGKMPHFALTGSAGFDMYEKIKGMQNFAGSFIPPFDIENGYDGILEFDKPAEREITINFPLYSGVDSLFVGLEKGSDILPPNPYRIEKPVVFYGSSITQGGCASRPGNCYQSIFSRTFDCDFVNLGFSENGKGEISMAEYISGLDMPLFVFDYDANAPTPKYLEKTHEPFFRLVREKNPDLPVILMSRPRYKLNEENAARLKIIEATMNDAVKRGDKNVYLISGPELMDMAQDAGTVDGIHPNDLGFSSMVIALCDTVRKNGIL